MKLKPAIRNIHLQSLRVKRLRAALEAVLALAVILPGKIAGTDDPMGMAEHISGLIVRCCREELDKECGE